MTLWYVFTELVAVEWIRRNIVPDGREWFRISVHTSEAFTDTSSEWNYNLSCVKQRDNNNVANAETLHYFLNSGIDNQSGSHAQIPYLQQCSQIPKSRDVTLFFFRHNALQVSGHALFTSTPHVFLQNIFINKTERSIHFYWIHFLNKIVTWLRREYVYLWYRLLEINVGTRDTAADL